MAADDELALFPLSNVVLFPKLQVPLHLFEPRYRQLARDVLAASRRIGMVAVAPEHVAGMAGDPPLYPVGCAGLVTQAQKLPDGRYNIVLEGGRRFRIRVELPRAGERLYRRARVEWLGEPYPEAARPAVAALRERIAELVERLARAVDPAGAEPVGAELFQGLDDERFVNAVSNALGFAAPEKQALLEAESLPRRFERLEGLLSFRLTVWESRGAPGSGAVH